jgi:ketosteroid isomerase-like protein
MSEENLERARRTFERFEAGDPSWTEVLHPDIEWDISAHPLPDVPDRGQGRDELLAFLSTYFSGWNDYRSELRELVDAGDDFVAVLHETVRMGETGTDLERDLVQVWTVRDGSWVVLRVFPTKQAALAALGLAE